MKRAQEWLHALGSAGVLGIGVLIFCVPFYFSAIRPAQNELQEQRSVAERLRSRTPFQSVSSEGRVEELRRFYGLFPPLFVGAMLKSMPIASLDALRFERKKAGDTQLEAQVRMTVYFRPANEGETP